LAAVQCKLELAPLARVLGLAVRLTVGSIAFTETVAVWVAVPSAPMHTRV
jgi:hypothetical protein